MRPGPSPAGRRVNVTGWVCNSCRVRQAAKHYLHSSPAPLVKTRNDSSGSSGVPRRGKLPETPARTRFAPSPTGNLHLGSIRTALFNYLLAKATGGQFLLRIEDTDAKRTVVGAEEQLYKDLRWAGLQWDEGPVVGGPYGPYRQSQRLALYGNHIETLLQTGRAYRCFCPSERLDELNRRRHDKGLSLGYDRKCLQIPAAQAEEKARRGEQHVVRFRSPEQWARYDDLVYGKSGHGAEKAKKLLVDEPVYEDAILMKSDGFPTYHWANVCDDHEMHITHVVRGSEWMASTPLHVALYQSLDWSPPQFAHVPLLVDQNKQKLSKRNFDSDIASFRDRGIFPEALVNFAALLGWSHTQKKDVMDLAQLESLFDLKITKGNTIVSLDKLHYLQEQHARRRVQAQGEDFEQMIRDVAVAVLERYGAGQVVHFLSRRSLHDVLASLLKIDSLRYRSPRDFADQCAIFLDPVVTRSKDLEVTSDDVSLLAALRIAASTLCLVPESSWTKEVHHSQLRALEASSPVAGQGHTDSAASSTDAQKTWKRELYQYLRWALLGGRKGPGIAESMEVLGRETCVRRIQAANSHAREVETAMTKAKPVVQAKGKDDDDEKGTSAESVVEPQEEKGWKGYSL